jgi:hypothetical protein
LKISKKINNNLPKKIATRTPEKNVDFENDKLGCSG